MSTIPLPRPKILVVDDTPANLIAMRRLLSKVDVDLIETRSGNEALAACLDHEFALVLLDVNMPEMDGFEVAELLAEESRTRDTPIIFVTAAYADDLNRLKGYSFGAVDYIAKPINDTILLSKIRVFLELYRSRAELKVALDKLSERNDQLQREVGERQRAEEKARHDATHDALTGLPNRLLFMDRLHNSIERARRRDSHCALLYIDIDGFKPVNDSYGHTVGDLLLCAIATRMSQTIRKIDSVARLGGDEFGVIIEEPLDDADAVISAERLNRSLREPYDLLLPDGRGRPFQVIVSASIGVALFPQHAQSTEVLIRVADDAMYRAKRAGKNLCILARAEGTEDPPLDITSI